MLSIALIAVVVLAAIFFKKIDGPNKDKLLDFGTDANKKGNSLDSKSFLTEEYCKECNTLLENSKMCSACGLKA